MINRRQFIRNSSLATLSLFASSQLARALPGQSGIGLQLYTVRGAMAQDLRGTLKKIARIGYTWLEAAGYSQGRFYGLAPAEFRSMSEDLGLQLVSSHATFTKDEQRQAIDAHAQLGVPYLVYPVFPIEQDGMVPDFRRAADRLNEIGEDCKGHGIRFGYHNHDFEFIDFEDARGYDTLLKSTDPEQVCFQPDFYWMYYAGVDPVDYIVNYPGRFELWHIKDMKDSSGKAFIEVGEGIIPYDEVFKYREQAGMKYFFVEQDHCKMDPLESIRISYQNLKAILNF